MPSSQWSRLRHRFDLRSAGPMAVALGIVLTACSTSAGTSGTSGSATSTTATSSTTLPPTSTTAASSTTTTTTPSGPPSYCSEGTSSAQPVAQPFTGVQFVGSKGWVVGTGQILGTLDGGTNWATQWQGSGRLQSVDFVTATDGWAVGPGLVLATTDGGSHWTSLPEPIGGLDAGHFSAPTALPR